MTSIFGPCISTWNVERAYIGLLGAATGAGAAGWLEVCLAEVERQNGLDASTVTRQPNIDCTYGGVDFLSYNQNNTPAVIVVVVPQGPPERFAEGIFQTYDVQVGVVVIDGDEDRARMIASFYGAAVMLAVCQHGGLQGVAIETVMTGAPRVSLPTADQRRIALCVTTFASTVSPIVVPSAGPGTDTPPESPEYGGTPDAPFGQFPTVATTDLTVTGEPLTS
jgi:hypothetical protein